MFWALAATFLLIAAVLTLWPLLVGKTLWKPMALLLVFAVPAAAAWLYQGVGTPAALEPEARQPMDLSGAGMADLTDRLQARLTATPEDLDGWVLLGRSYKTLQRYPEALQALETANRLVPEQPMVLVELVEARLFASGDPRITPEMVALLEQAVGSEPGLQKGYWLLGIAAAQRGDDAGAIARWEELLEQVEPGSGVADAVTAQIAEARTRLGIPAGESPPAGETLTAGEATVAGEAPLAGEAPVIGAAPLFAVEVTLSPTARETLGPLPPEATLFVVVRPAGAAAGPPLGARKIERPEFPLTLSLTDKDSMLPQRPISSAGEVEIQARLSFTGQALPVTGDWQSQPASGLSGQPIRLLLDQQVE
jgi:cytochrome c-type biogenesis protein CcmH